jgi:kinesin family protein 18/19
MPQGKRVKDQTFGFDRVFDENITQGDVYEATTKNLLDSVLDGFNATVFAYGATGCGKTHTITGTAQQPGIIFLTMQELFEKVGELQSEKATEITLSYLEIYNETIRDLLNPNYANKQGLMLREDANQVVSVAGRKMYKKSWIWSSQGTTTGHSRLRKPMPHHHVRMPFSKLTSLPNLGTLQSPSQ